MLDADFGIGARLLPLSPATLASASAHVSSFQTHDAEDDAAVPPPRVGMHGALLRWPPTAGEAQPARGKSRARLLAVFRLSDVSDAASGAASLPSCHADGSDDDEEDADGDDVCPAQWARLLARRTSSLYYAELDEEPARRSRSAYLSAPSDAFGVPRWLPLSSPPSIQLLRGPEDGRLFALNGRACLLYNDVLPEAQLPRWPRDAPAARTAMWRMRRGLYLSCLTRRDGGATSGNLAAQLIPSAPLLLRASPAVLRTAGAASDIEKNWVPFVYNATLHLAYSLDPHLVLRVSPQALADAEDLAAEAAELQVDTAPVEVSAELVYATRFEHADSEAPAGRAGRGGAASLPQHSEGSDAPSRPQLRGGTPPVRIDKTRHLAIMHTVIRRGGKSRYAVAAYTFSTRPPFAIQAVSRPFDLGGHATPYPVGLVSTADGKDLLLSYGFADSAWHVARLSRNALLKSLVPVRTEPMPRAFDTDSRDESSALPTRLHFARGAPKRVREEVVKALQGQTSPPLPPKARGPRVIGYPYF